MSTLLDCPDRIHLDRWNWASWFRIGLQPWPHQSPCAHSAPRGLAGRLVPPAAPLRGGERDADWHWYSRSGRCAQTRQAWGSLFNGVHRNLTGSGAESAAPPSRVFGGGKGGRRACGARVAILRFCIDEQLCRRGRGEAENCAHSDLKKTATGTQTKWMDNSLVNSFPLVSDQTFYRNARAHI